MADGLPVFLNVESLGFPKRRQQRAWALGKNQTDPSLRTLRV